MSSRSLRRAVLVVLTLAVLAVAGYLVWKLSDDDSAPRDSAPAQTDEPLSGIVTDEIVATITTQASSSLGRPVTVTCPPRIELTRDNTVTCQITEAEGETPGQLITEAIVTITDPSASEGARWSWRSTG